MLTRRSAASQLSPAASPSVPRAGHGGEGPHDDGTNTVTSRKLARPRVAANSTADAARTERCGRERDVRGELKSCQATVWSITEHSLKRQIILMSTSFSNNNFNWIARTLAAGTWCFRQPIQQPEELPAGQRPQPPQERARTKRKIRLIREEIICSGLSSGRAALKPKPVLNVGASGGSVRGVRMPE